MSDDALTDRRKELEETFFAKQNQELIDKLRAQKQKALDKAGIQEITGIKNEEVLEKLVSLKLDRETISALSLFPLIQIAWADGAVDAREQAAVLSAADASGIGKGSSAHTLLESWLKLKPPAALENAWSNYVKALVEGMSAGEKLALRSELLNKARAVAEASGGILGMGSKISKAESDTLTRLEAAFR